MKMNQELTQRQCMNQQTIQSIEILQMSMQELEDYLKDLSVENPVIDLENAKDISSEEEDRRKKLEWLNSTDSQNRIYYTQDYDDSNQDVWNFDENKGETLSEYLLSQLAVSCREKVDMKLLEYMIYSLDSKGYLTENMEDIAFRCHTNVSQVEKALWRIQELDPAGVGARDLRECLLLQMKRKGNKNLIAETIVREYLDVLGNNQLSLIAKKLKASMDNLKTAIEVIKSLNPKPGNSFASRETLKYIVPDITVVKFQDYYQVLLNEYTYPELRINSYYKNLLKTDAAKETKDYVSEKIRQAQWVQECISQRNSTMLHVAKILVERQQSFFLKGPGHLLPLKLRDIADELGVHESTVSRTLKDKYLQCPWGIYPMNYFLTTGLGRIGSGSQISAEQIKHMIKQIIEEEDKKKPYSDRAITELLNQKEVKISRRTVAKYRESMGIEDTGKRKEF